MPDAEACPESRSPGCSAKPLVSAHDRIMGTHRFGCTSHGDHVRNWAQPEWTSPGFTAPVNLPSPVGAGNSAVVVDLPRCGPMLIPRVPHHVPLPGVHWHRLNCAFAGAPRTLRSSCCVTNSVCCADRSTDPSSVTPTGACSQRSRLRYQRPSRAGWAGHPRHTVALAPAPHRRTLDSITVTAGAGATSAVSRSTCRDCGLAAENPNCTESYRIHGELGGLGNASLRSRPQILRTRNRPRPTRAKFGRTHTVPGPSPCDFATIDTVTRGST